MLPTNENIATKMAEHEILIVDNGAFYVLKTTHHDMTPKHTKTKNYVKNCKFSQSHNHPMLIID